MAARLANQLSDNLLAVAVAAHQPAISLRLFDRVQILALNILDQRYLGPRFFVEFTNYGWNLMELSALGGSPSPFPRDQHIAVGYRPHEDRLENAWLGNRGCELGQRLFIENLPGLSRIWPNTGNIDRSDAAGSGGWGLGPDSRRIVDERAEAAPQTGSLLHAASASMLGDRAIISRASRT